MYFKKQQFMRLLLHLFIIALGIVMIYPVIWMISGSMKNNTEILNDALNLVPPHWRFDNFVTGWKGFGGINFGTFITNSLIITVLSTLGTTLSSACVAYAFTRIKFRGRSALFVIMLATMMIPAQVIMIPQYIIWNQLGFVGSYVPLILPHFFGVAFFIYQMMQFMVGIPVELDESAYMDGASKYTIFTKIIMPLLKPSIITTIIIQFYWKWDDFMGPLIYLNKPTSYTVSLALKMFADSSSRTDFGAMFAMSTLSLLPVFLIFLFFNKYLVEGISTSGMKA
ncbi:MAG: carbohydrate ABC transporter permease [Lactobacillaceae bacterium]|jgi:multiple sugar transport system permease protein|nr:carbohydrate ABC transporter permease [Lactobacillaceae bacterium]